MLFRSLASAHDRHPHHPRPNPWQGLVRATVARMTLHEKVGQLFMIAIDTEIAAGFDHTCALATDATPTATVAATATLAHTTLFRTAIAISRRDVSGRAPGVRPRG